jgi:hypothetical protein
LLWVHNDSGDEARVYGINRSGDLVATLELPTSAQDFEAIALLARVEAADYLFVADTGDNLRTRADGVFVHRFEEPTSTEIHAGLNGASPKPRIDTMHLKFPAGPQDVEAFLVDPQSGELIFISKTFLGYPLLFRVRAFAAEATAELVGTMSPERTGQAIHFVTAADVSLDGAWVLVRTYTDVLLFSRSAGSSLTDALLGPACALPLPDETQGEAIAFMAGPASTKDVALPPPYVTIAEGAHPVLHEFGFASTPAMQHPELCRP